ncbi:MAG: phosphate ABC transporter substrate-binding protein PstS [Candidatus Bathyarchaeota archaeon]|nr:phosphate ABC transporter substrate-binding protein PstS [Candidatus Bathyarchaeota archaeon]
MKTAPKILIAVALIAITLAAALSYIHSSQPPQTVALSGTGATFPKPLLTEMINNYRLVKTNIQITYSGSGSSSGINALQEKSVDFVCSDVPLSTTDRTQAPNALHIPETIGAVAVAYNLPDIPTGLNLTGETLADIFAGTITRWDDPAIQDINVGVLLPSEEITVVHRSDGSGTTFIFTSYLSEVSVAWNASIGAYKTVSWPVGLGAEGNPGLAGVVQGNPYSIGYVELAYTIQNDMSVAAVRNPSGNFVVPSLESTQIAAQSGAFEGLPAGDEDWTEVNLLNTPDPQAYPIVSFSYMMVYSELNVIPDITQNEAAELVEFLWWVVHEGQDCAPELEYAPIPANVVQLNEATLRSITFDGHTLLTK